MYQNQQSGTNNGGMVPEAKQALNNMKFEIANELGINLKQGYICPAVRPVISAVTWSSA